MPAPPSAWRTVVSLAMALAVVMGIGRFAYTPILPSMQSQAGLSTQAAGALASVNFAGYLLGALLFSLAAHWRSRLWLYHASLLLSVLTTAAMALTTDFTLWSGLRFVSGIVSAGVLIAGAGIALDDLAAKGKTHLLGFIFGGVGGGIALSGIAVQIFDGALGWRGDWLVLGAISLVLAVPGWLWLRDTRPPEPAGEKSHEGRLRPSWPLALLLASYSLEGLGYIITGTFLVAILKATPGLEAVGVFSWTVAGLAGIPSTVLWGLAAKRMGVVPALVLAYGLQVVGIALPVLTQNPVAALVAAALFGGTFLGIVTLALSFARDIAPAAAGPVVGVLTIGYSIGQILGPWGAGLLMERQQSFDLPLLAAAGAVLISAVLAVGAQMTKRPTA